MYPLVSVIIPCFNYANYLPVAIESVLKQTYPRVEVLIVDDGSIDNTREVANSYPNIVYIFQNNQGLSASRNNGLEKCSGEYVIFLDADDWLYPDCISTNLRYLQEQPKAAFVSGGFKKIHSKEELIEEFKYKISTEIYQRLLYNNFLSAPGAVMYQRWVFDEFRYDESLKACEDYDLYLKISRKYRTIHHNEIIAAYRIHGSNMSSNIPAMLSSALKVLRRQKRNLKSFAELIWYRKGLSFWKTHYCDLMYKKLFAGENNMSKNNLHFLFRNRPYFFFKAIVSCYLSRGNFRRNEKMSGAI